MRPLDKFVCETPQEEAAMELSRQLCDEGRQLCEQGKYQEAIVIFQQDLQLCEKVCGVDHGYVANSLIDISECYRALGQINLALAMSRHALDIYESGLGVDHWLVARGVREMALAYAEQGKSDKALSLYRRVLEIRKNNYGAESEEVAWTISALASLHAHFDQFEEALLLYQLVLAMREKLFGEEHADSLAAIRCLSNMYEKLGQWDLALPLRQRVWAVCEKLGKAAIDKAANVATTAEYQNDSHRDALADRAIAKANELIIRLASDIESGDYCAGYWKEYDIYPLAHHAVLGYLEHLWAGGEKDDGFELRSLKNDFNMKGINVAALCYLVAEKRSVPFDKVLHFLAPNAPDADDSIAAIFQKIMVIAPAMNEAGLSGEIKYLAGVVCGAFLEPNQIRYNSAQIHDDFDSVGFIVKYCKALELLKHY